MSTNNFHNENATRVYSFSENDEQAFDDMESNIAASLELLHQAGVQDPDELRSYPSRVLGYLEEYEAFRVQWDDIELTVRIFPVIRSGYYEGGNLDWFIEIEDVLGNDIRNLSHILPANITSDEKDRAKDEIYAWIEEAKSRLISKVEEVYNIYTTALNHVGTFSNGETIYQLAEEEE